MIFRRGNKVISRGKMKLIPTFIFKISSFKKDVNGRFDFRGMTLVEVMIAIAILSILSITTSRMLLQAYKDKMKIDHKIESESRIESARNLIIKDISRAFHHQEIRIKVYNSIRKDRKKELEKQAERARSANRIEEALKYTKKASEIMIRSKSKKLTHFIGDKNSLYFTSTNHARTIKDSPSSQLIELGYFTKGCRGRFSNKEFKTCLWRSVSHALDDNLEKGGENRVLLENVKKVHFSYHPGGEDIDQKSRWKEKWRSDYLGSASVRGKFPRVVKVLLEFQSQVSKKSKMHSLEFMVPIHFPNNKEFKMKSN